MLLTAHDIVGTLNELPPFPKVTAKLLALLEDESVSLSDISEVLSHDPALSIKVVMMSNSPFYMVSHQIESISDAVLILGVGTVSSLALSISLQKCLSAMSPRSGCFDMTSFWKHSYATAIAGRQLCHTQGVRTCDRVYLAGLIHDIGKLIQGYLWPEAWQSAVNALEQSQTTYSDIERTYFSASCAEITSALCSTWRMSPSIIEMLEQATSAQCESVDETSRSQLSIAHTIANACGFSFPGGELEDMLVASDIAYEELIKSLPYDVEHQLKSLNI